MVTLNELQEIYDNQTLDEREFCTNCEEEIDGNFVYINNNLHCECCADIKG